LVFALDHEILFPQLIRQASKKKSLDAAPLSLEKRNKAAEGGRNIRYWYGVAHAKVQENMGLGGQRDLCEAHSAEMMRIHFHDVRGLDEHLAFSQA
jgi:hypothetical protein